MRLLFVADESIFYCTVMIYLLFEVCNGIVVHSIRLKIYLLLENVAETCCVTCMEKKCKT